MLPATLNATSLTLLKQDGFRTTSAPWSTPSEGVGSVNTTEHRVPLLFRSLLFHGTTPHFFQDEGCVESRFPPGQEW